MPVSAFKGWQYHLGTCTSMPMDAAMSTTYERFLYLTNFPLIPLSGLRTTQTGVPPCAAGNPASTNRPP